MGRRGRDLADVQLRSRKNNNGKVLQELGPVSLMFEDRFCNAGQRHEINEKDLQATTERAAAYKGSQVEEYDMSARPKSSRLVARKPKSVAQLLSDLSLGLDQEVLPISFPHICLNIECTSVIWRLEDQLRDTHQMLPGGDIMPPGFGIMALQLLAGLSDKLWVVADEVHKYVRNKAPGSTKGCAAVTWVLENIRDPLRATIQEMVRESMQEQVVDREEHTTTRFGSPRGTTVSDQDENAHQKPSHVDTENARATQVSSIATGCKEGQSIPEPSANY